MHHRVGVPTLALLALTSCAPLAPPWRACVLLLLCVGAAWDAVFWLRGRARARDDVFAPPPESAEAEGVRARRDAARYMATRFAHVAR